MAATGGDNTRRAQDDGQPDEWPDATRYQGHIPPCWLAGRLLEVVVGGAPSDDDMVIRGSPTVEIRVDQALEPGRRCHDLGMRVDSAIASDLRAILGERVCMAEGVEEAGGV